MRKHIITTVAAVLCYAISAFAQSETPQPQNVKITEQTSGVVVTWDAIDADASASVAYNVYDKQYQLLAGGLKTTTFTDEATPLTGDQQRLFYYVSAVADGNESTMAISNRLVVGTPYDLPFHDSFDKKHPSGYFWWGDNSGWSSFAISSQYTVDDEYGAMVLQLYDLADKSTINTGKISLASADNPALMFSQGVWGGYNIKLHVYLTKADGEKVLLKSYDYSEASSREWGREVISLAAYKDEPYVMINFEPEARTADMPIVIDNVYVIDYLKNNLQAKLTVPSAGAIGADAMITVRVTNLGQETAKGYKVHLYKDGEIFETVTDASNIPTYYDLARFFYFVPELTDPETVQFSTVVEYSSDADQSDNAYGPLPMQIKQPLMPYVDDLSGEIDDKGCAVLTWSKPEIAAAVRQSDSFETYDAWSTSGMGYWTTVDNDFAMTYGIDGINYEHEGEPMSFIVFYPAALGINAESNPEFAPHSGQQYLMSIAAVGQQTPDGHNDDWLISPPIANEEQTIELYAKAMSANYRESFEIYYSSKTADIDDFQLLQTVANVPTTWTRYEQIMPLGAKYFAVRCTSADAYALMIDDITYKPADMILERYNVYRDKKVIASVNADATNYTDRSTNGQHDYRIGAIYNYGESRLSNTVSLYGTTAIETIPAADNSLEATEIFSIDGRKVATVGSNSTEMTKGIYILRDKPTGKTKKIVRK